MLLSKTNSFSTHDLVPHGWLKFDSDARSKAALGPFRPTSVREGILLGRGGKNLH